SSKSVPSSSRIRIYTFPAGNAAWATRAVSGGTGGSCCRGKLIRHTSIVGLLLCSLYSTIIPGFHVRQQYRVRDKRGRQTRNLLIRWRHQPRSTSSGGFCCESTRTLLLGR